MAAINAANCNKISAAAMGKALGIPAAFAGKIGGSISTDGAKTAAINNR